MRLSVKNFGVIGQGEVEINGITVLTGENGTGKSTISKILYCCYRVFYDAETKIRNEYESQIMRILYMTLRNSDIDDSNSLISYTEDILNQYEKSRSVVLPEGIIGNLSTEQTTKLVDRIIKVLSIDRGEVLQLLLERTMDTEFGGQVNNVNHPRKSVSFKLDIGDDKKIEYVKKQSLTTLTRNVRMLNYDAVYIEDPYIIDNISSNQRFRARVLYSRFSHQADLIDKLQHDFDSESVINTILAEESWKEIEGLINEMINGGQLEQKNGGYSYQDRNMKKPISLENLSTGMKSILILKTLLMNGSLNNTKTIIFDEPEIHLHPDWQYKLAEILVLLPTVFDVKVLISTHSTEFISAIDYFTKKHGVRGLTKLYQLKRTDGEYACINDVTENIDEIYSALGKAFLQIANDL